MYLYRFDDSNALLHFDVIYNTVDRTWKVWVYESAQILFPFRHNATEPGLLATISKITAYYPGALDTVHHIIQVFCWDKSVVRSSYVPSGTKLLFDPSQDTAHTTNQILVLPSSIATLDENGVVVFGEPFADAYGSLVTIIGAEGYYSGFGVGSVSDVLKEVFTNGDKYFTFRNYQFLDTGYRKDELQAKKRYREIQLLIDNLDNTNIQFGMDYMLDGTYNKIYYKYDTTQVIDEFDPDYGIIYIDSTPYLEVDLSNLDNMNQWMIDQNETPEVSFWKVRVAVSGKGTAPRLKLYSKNEKSFGLLSLNWVSRIMHMR